MSEEKIKEIEMAEKMTQEKVQEMRRMYGEGATQGALARHFQLGIAQVGRIVRGECWQRGAGLRMPTQVEADAALARLLETQRLAQARREMEAADPVLKAWSEETQGLANLGAAVCRPPPMLLEGGDAPDEAPGASSALQERAKAMGLDIDKLTKETKHD